jgi:O-antigen ligase
LKKELNVQIHFLLVCLLAFLIPVLPAVIPGAIVLLALNWLAGKNYGNLTSKKKDRLWFLLSISLYAMYIAGMAWSTNTAFGLKDLETKLSLLVFPVIFFSSEKPGTQKLLDIATAFIYGCLTAAALCLGRALYYYFHVKYLAAHNVFAWDYGIDFFLKERLSIWIHPGYISMYFVMALACLHWIKITKGLFSVWMKYLIPFTLSVFILLFNSKAGIISLFLLGVYAAWHLIFREKKIIAVAIGFMLMVLVFASLYFSESQFAIRINGAIHTLSGTTNIKNNEESTASRIEIWNAAESVISEHYFTGTGTGDVKDALLHEYNKEGMVYAFKENLNAHNQFLQTFAALGITGFFFLCASLLLPLWVAWKKKNYLYTTFILIMLLNLLTESMFETQAGVIFYAFFNSLFLFPKNKKHDSILPSPHY